jgi:hypothetical protein
MTEQEAKEIMERVCKYRALEKVRDEVRTALEVITQPWTDGPCGQGPFTGNTRESRQVSQMTIQFTATRGGSPAVSVDIYKMHIEAHELGRALKEMLGAKLEAINAEIEKI